MPEPAQKALLSFNDLLNPREVAIEHTPFTIGRHPDCDLVLEHPYISRNHAQIVFENDAFHLVDVGSRSGTYVNGKSVLRHRLADGDEIRIGSPDGTPIHLQVHPTSTTNPFRTLLGQMQENLGSDLSLSKLSWFVEAARRLNNLGAVNEILEALIETTLLLTRVERGYVFLRDDSGELVLAAGRNTGNELLSDDSTISHSALRRAIESGLEFIVTDTLSEGAAAPSQSMVAQSLRTIICIPLRKRGTDRNIEDRGQQETTLGVLYLDSRQQRSKLNRVDNDLLNIVAAEAAVLVENATLVQAEEEGRRYREEMKIACQIQEGLMRVRIPELSYAHVNAQSVPCTGIAGDFFDVISVESSLYVVVADISGKGISAALLGSTLQGIIYAQVLAGQPLAQIALFANQYICHKDIGKYATLVILRLDSDGCVEYINCGHLQPLVHRRGNVVALSNANLPVGLLTDAVYTADSCRMQPGERILIVTDGVTEAEDPAGSSFGDDRLHALIQNGADLGGLLRDVARFTQGKPLEDDCTILEVCFASCPVPNLTN